MSDVSGIPNMGFGGGSYFGGSGLANAYASQAQTNNYLAQQQAALAQANAYNPWANSGGSFGAMPAYYAALGAAYGRSTGGFRPGMPASPSGTVTRSPLAPISSPPPLPQGQPFQPGMTSAPRSPFTGMSFGGNRDFLAYLMMRNASPQPPALTPPPNQGQQDFQSVYGPRTLPLYMPPMPEPSVTVPGQQGNLQPGKDWAGQPTVSS
jgi:hypothetical protein